VKMDDALILEVAESLPGLDRERWRELDTLIKDKRLLRESQDALEHARTNYIVAGEVSGTNELQRRAHLDQLSEAERRAVLFLQGVVDRSEVAYKRACGQYETARILLQLAGAMAGSREEHS
jgi:hypothetical protein